MVTHRGKGGEITNVRGRKSGREGVPIATLYRNENLIQLIVKPNTLPPETQDL